MVLVMGDDRLLANLVGQFPDTVIRKLNKPGGVCLSLSLPVARSRPSLSVLCFFRLSSRSVALDPLMNQCDSPPAYRLFLGIRISESTHVPCVSGSTFMGLMVP